MQNFFNESPGTPSDRIILLQNYPNPFNETTTISYQLPVSGRVKLKIYNILGQKIKTLTNEIQSANYHEKNWNISEENYQISSGIYFLNLSLMGDNQFYFEENMKMLLVK